MGLDIDYSTDTIRVGERRLLGLIEFDQDPSGGKIGTHETGRLEPGEKLTADTTFGSDTDVPSTYDTQALHLVCLHYVL